VKYIVTSNYLTGQAEYPEKIPPIQQFAQDGNPNALSIGSPLGKRSLGLEKFD
jgi:hypothetical protein